VRRALACVAVAFAAALAPAVEAGVKTEEKTLVRFGGTLGGILNKFGGKAAKEGVVQTVAVVGDRKLTLSGERGEIVDLAEEKIYELDAKKRTYTVTTFAELKARIEEQRAEAEKAAAEARKKEEKPREDAPERPATEMEVDVEMGETGQKRAIAGHEKVRAESEKVNMEGTPLASGLTITLWKSAAQVAEAQKQSEGMGGGLSGLLAKKLTKQGDPSDPRSDVLTSTSEMLNIAPDAGPADVAMPAGYKLK